ncbi:hypothetical protein J7E99_03365 [Streptomyces sp. ISL-44]|uniref:hypothetical protein n=1 Tax=Streptomyces sp. ISL-44 TaxID=2819184 RepID=UPI001BEAD863|nr:hypothetical protein [Streptomyces sp. ISL-44]MBT2539767.1 hypothetical protein [Streptomyces sp. ISL-44]
MQLHAPREASLCLPTRPWRLFWALTALTLGTAAGLLFQRAFAEPATAVGIAVTTTEIALHIGELAMEISTLARATPHTARALAHRLTPALLAVTLGAAAGTSFHLLFGHLPEAVAVGVTSTVITLHLAGPLIHALATPMHRATANAHAHTSRLHRSALQAARRMAQALRDLLERPFDGFGGTPTLKTGAP